MPLSAVAPHVQAWVDAYDGGAYVSKAKFRAEHPEWGKVESSLGVMTLADKMKCSPRTIDSWLRARTEYTIGFFDADRLFTAMQCTGLWQQDPELRRLREAAEGGNDVQT